VINPNIGGKGRENWRGFGFITTSMKINKIVPKESCILVELFLIKIEKKTKI